MFSIVVRCCRKCISGLQLRLVAGSVLADVAAPQPQLHQGPGLHQAVAQQHHRGHEQLVNIPDKRVVSNKTCKIQLNKPYERDFLLRSRD